MLRFHSLHAVLVLKVNRLEVLLNAYLPWQQSYIVCLIISPNKMDLTCKDIKPTNEKAKAM